MAPLYPLGSLWHPFCEKRPYELILRTLLMEGNLPYIYIYICIYNNDRTLGVQSRRIPSIHNVRPNSLSRRRVVFNTVFRLRNSWDSLPKCNPAIQTAFDRQSVRLGDPEPRSCIQNRMAQTLAVNNSSNFIACGPLDSIRMM